VFALARICESCGQEVGTLVDTVKGWLCPVCSAKVEAELAKKKYYEEKLRKERRY
jgi:DNA-directed RNA polymerase subunit RPC12/RpoP